MTAQQITTKTLIPISLAGAIGIGSFWLSNSNAQIEENSKKIESNVLDIRSVKDENNDHYIEIIQRLSRIEEAIKK